MRKKGKKIKQERDEEKRKKERDVEIACKDQEIDRKEERTDTEKIDRKKATSYAEK